MKIKFLSGLAGMDAAGAVILFNVGDVVEWNDEEAERLIAAGIADEVTTVKTVKAVTTVTASKHAGQRSLTEQEKG
jgi:hypothetical protein